MKLQPTYDILVVGAGLSGIAAALRCKSQGKSVLVVDKNTDVGGKLSSFSKGGYRFDQGPSLFTEPHLIEELFHLFNKNPQDYFQFEKLDSGCTYFFHDGSKLHLSHDLKESYDNVKNLFSTKSADNYKRYLEHATEDYLNIGPLFIDEPKPRGSDFLKPRFISKYPYFLKKKMRSNLNAYNQKSFEESGLVQVFNRFGTYNGSNPYEMSGLFSMISSLELTQGAYFPAKGMRSIVTSLYKLAVEEKVDFMFGKNAQLTPNADGHFSLKGTNIRATQIISAIDHLTFHEHVLPNDKMHARYSPLERSSSGLVFYWGVSTTIPDLTVHNIFFGDNYQREFQSIFNDKLNYKAPTVYVHVSSLVNSKDAPDNSMNLFVMINTSAHDAPNEEYRRGMKKYVEYIFLKKFGVSLNEHRVVDEYWDNDSIQERSGSFTGALYGPASNSISAVLRRHPNKLNNTPNVFFCGGTVHPGGGIPLVLRSAKIVADLI